LEVASREGQYEKASRLRYYTIPDLEKQLPKDGDAAETETVDPDSPLASFMLHERVTSDDIARVVAKATGIPVRNLLKGERDKLVYVGIYFPNIWSLLNFVIDGRFPSPTCSGPRPCPICRQ
jgi:ATP-dependent Clp protease ATP-binding subunit ClpB